MNDFSCILTNDAYFVSSKFFINVSVFYIQKRLVCRRRRRRRYYHRRHHYYHHHHRHGEDKERIVHHHDCAIRFVCLR